MAQNEPTFYLLHNYDAFVLNKLTLKCYIVVRFPWLLYWAITQLPLRPLMYQESPLISARRQNQQPQNDRSYDPQRKLFYAALQSDGGDVAPYRLVQGEAQAAMFVQHEESPLPFLWDAKEALRIESTWDWRDDQKHASKLQLGISASVDSCTEAGSCSWHQ